MKIANTITNGYTDTQQNDILVETMKRTFGIVDRDRYNADLVSFACAHTRQLSLNQIWLVKNSVRIEGLMANVLRYKHSKIDKCPRCQDAQNTDHVFFCSSDDMTYVFELNKEMLVETIAPAKRANILEVIVFILTLFINEDGEEL